MARRNRTRGTTKSRSCSNCATQIGELLRYGSKRLRNCIDVVRAATANHQKSLMFAGAVPRDDHALVLRAVTKNGSVLRFGSKRLRNNIDVVRAATTKYPQALQFFGPVPQDDQDFILHLLTKYRYYRTMSAWILQFANDRVRDDASLVLTAVSCRDDAYKYAGRPCRIIFSAVAA